MLRFGPRRVMLTSLILIAFGVAATTQLRSLVQLYLLWGVVVGLGTGSTALVLSATVVNRWFTTHRGLALGLLGAATSTGRLIFLPLLTAVVISLGWQAVGWIVAGCITLLVLPLAAILMRASPAQMGFTPYRGVSAAASADAPAPDSGAEPLVPLWTALRHGDFWRLWLTFAICGATTNGLIGTHLIPHAIDLGVSEVAAAGAPIAGIPIEYSLAERVPDRALLPMAEVLGRLDQRRGRKVCKQIQNHRHQEMRCR